MSDAKGKCPLRNEEGRCSARQIPCIPGDETCLAAIRAYFDGKHEATRKAIAQILKQQNKELDDVISAVLRR